MKFKIITFVVIVLLMITPCTSSINICEKQQNLSIKSRVGINEKLNDNNITIKSWTIYFLFGRISNWHLHTIPWDGGLRTDVVFMFTNVLFIEFGYSDYYSHWYFQKYEHQNDRFVFTFINDIFIPIGIFGQHFVCGLILVRYS